jgi:hypothetical protein
MKRSASLLDDEKMGELCEEIQKISLSIEDIMPEKFREMLSACVTSGNGDYLWNLIEAQSLMTFLTNRFVHFRSGHNKTTLLQRSIIAAPSR